MVSKEKQNKRKERLSIDEKIQILLNHGNIGDIKIRRKNAGEEEKKLGEIVNSLRRAYKEGRLTQIQIKTLEENGMIWKRQEAGRSIIDLLIASGINIGDIKQNGKDLTEEERKLGQAKHSLKVAYRNGLLSDKIIKEAEAHGMIWNEKQAGIDMLKVLVASGINIGDMQQKGKKLTEEEKRLGDIKHRLIVAYRKGKLSEDVIREAEAHGMVWSGQEVGRKALDILIASGINIGDIQQKGKNMTEEERKLGQAKHNLKIAYRKGMLSENVIREAEEHGMVWREVKSRKKGSSLEALRRQKEDLEIREEKAKELLRKIQEEVRKKEANQNKDTLDREER